MYPQRAMQINAPANPLLTALTQAGIVPHGTDCCAIQLQMQGGSAAVRVLLPTGDVQAVCPQQLYQALYSLFQDIWRRLDRTAALCLVADAPTIAAVNGASVPSWLAAQVVPVLASDPSDRAPAPLVAYGADQLRPLTTPFDAVGLLYNGKVKPGVRVIAIRQDEFGAFLVFDGPQSPGAPVPSAEIAEHVIAPLLYEAQALGGTAIICDVRTQRTYAASVGAMFSFVARQHIPRDEPPALDSIIANVHPVLREAASEARAWAMSGDTFRKSIGAILCLLCGLICVFCTWLLYQMGVMPVYETIRGWSGLSIFDSPDRAITLALFGSSMTLTVAWVFSWSFTFLELVGVMFGSLPWMGRVLYSAAAVDALINAMYYFRKMLPDLTQYSVGEALLLGFANLIGACIIGALMAWFWEAAAVISFVMAVALFPALVWAAGAALRGTGNTAIRSYYAVADILDDWGNTREDLAAHVAGQTQVVFVNGPRPTPRYGLLIGTVALVSIGGIGLWFVVTRMRGG